MRLHLGNDRGKCQRARIRARFLCLAASLTGLRLEALSSGGIFRGGGF
jgi:hypothetical protein